MGKGGWLLSGNCLISHIYKRWNILTIISFISRWKPCICHILSLCIFSFGYRTNIGTSTWKSFFSLVCCCRCFCRHFPCTSSCWTKIEFFSHSHTMGAMIVVIVAFVRVYRTITTKSLREWTHSTSTTEIAIVLANCVWIDCLIWNGSVEIPAIKLYLRWLRQSHVIHYH